MGDVLSQSEIDALLAAFAAGETVQENSDNSSQDESRVSSAVLEENLKFTDRDIRRIKDIHQEYTRMISTEMFKDLKMKVSLESIQEIRYEEFMRSIPCPAVVTGFKLHPLEGCLLFETSPSLIFQIEDIFSGGDRSQQQNSVGFSENDKNIAMQVTGDFIAYLEKAWSKVLKVKCDIEFIESDPAQIKIFPNNESVALLSFFISIGQIDTFFNLCIAYSSIERYLEKLDIKHKELEITGSKNELNHSLNHTDLNLEVIVDTLQLSLGEFMNLQKGTIVTTNKRYTNKVSIMVEGQFCFRGEVGRMGNRKAVKIVDCVDKDV